MNATSATSHCTNVWDDVVAGVPPGLAGGELIYAEGGKCDGPCPLVRTALMARYTSAHSSSGGCLLQDDYEGLLTLYPVCIAGGAPPKASCLVIFACQASNAPTASPQRALRSSLMRLPLTAPTTLLPCTTCNHFPTPSRDTGNAHQHWPAPRGHGSVRPACALNGLVFRYAARPACTPQIAGGANQRWPGHSGHFPCVPCSLPRQ